MITHSPRAAEDPWATELGLGTVGTRACERLLCDRCHPHEHRAVLVGAGAEREWNDFRSVWFGGSTANPAAVVGLHRDPETGANSTTMTALYAERAPGEARVTSSCGCLCL